MKKRHDPDLDFLSTCTSEELDPLVKVLTLTSDGNQRVTSTLEVNDLYIKHHPEHSRYWQKIAAEIQYFGADSVATLVRGNRGVPYREVLRDVCDRLKVNYHKDKDSTGRIEEKLIMKVSSDILSELSPEELQELADEVRVRLPDGVKVWAAELLIRAILRQGGFSVYIWSLKLANGFAKHLIGRGISFVGNQVLVQAIAKWLGPVGWGISALLAGTMLTGPAYRVTVPAVLQVAALRRKVHESE